MSPTYHLEAHDDDVETFTGPYGYAAVRQPAKSSTAPKKIGVSQGTFYGFWRVAFVVKGMGADVYQVADEEEGREVAAQLVEEGDLGDLEPNDGRFKVTADMPYKRSTAPGDGSEA